MTDVMAVRTRFFDDFFLDAGPRRTPGIRQAVILASGLDSRAYRLPWPDGTVVYEIDQPQVIECKTATMAEIGADADRRPAHGRRRPARRLAARRCATAGFDATCPTAWSAEGLLSTCRPRRRTGSSTTSPRCRAPGSRLATEYHPDGGASLGERARRRQRAWRDHGFDVDMRRPVLRRRAQRRSSTT